MGPTLGFRSGVGSLVFSVIIIMLNSEEGKSCCEEYFDFSSLFIIGGSCGILLLLWVVLRYRQEVNYR